MKKINWGIIGCGDVTEIKSGPAFNKVADSALAAVMRRDAARAADYARRHAVPMWYNDAAALIRDPQVNAIYVATPPATHELYSLAAMAAGKPVNASAQYGTVNAYFMYNQSRGQAVMLDAACDDSAISSSSSGCVNGPSDLLRT